AAFSSTVQVTIGLMLRTICNVALLLSITIASGSEASTVEFRFGSRSAGISGLANATVTCDGFAMSLAAGPAGATFTEGDPAGMGIRSREIAGAIDESTDKFNLLGGSVAGQTESVTFSFDTAGMLTELYFDGVKDESFEFFRLETPSGEVLSIFDSQIGLRLNDINNVTEPNVTLLSETGGADDDLFGLAIPFQAGESFTLTYGEYLPTPAELPTGFIPDTGNGARFQGVTITAIPEPTATGLVVLAIFASGALRRR
ncbi:MAG: hypothetical protein AAF266_09305, partial [Planctomycetota bacterium]